MTTDRRPRLPNHSLPVLPPSPGRLDPAEPLVPLEPLEPLVPLRHLDALWFQVAGTLCNFTCAHCFISCSPTNRRFGMMTLSEVCEHLADSERLGVKEYYFTGGEPFLNPEFIEIVLRTLEYGPVTVLTNASVLPDDGLRRWKAAEDASCYGLEFRVSLDGFSSETNDPIRGSGTFVRTMRGLRKLLEYGFLPLVTMVRTWEMRDERAVVESFLRQFHDQGYARPRLKILPTIRLGAEVQRTHGYAADERVTAEMLEGFDLDQLLCHHARLVSDQGVHACPLLLDDPAARLGDRLSDGLRPVAVSAAACHTCYQHGAICSNFAR